MNAEIYISVSSEQGRLIVDGNLELLREFLQAVRESRDDAPVKAKTLQMSNVAQSKAKEGARP